MPTMLLIKKHEEINNKITEIKTILNKKSEKFQNHLRP